MDKLPAKFLRIVYMINTNLTWVCIGFDTEKAPWHVSTVMIVLGSALYMVFIVKCISEISHLETASGMVYHIPWMLQYSLKAANMYLQYDLARQFLCWANDVLTAVHPIPFVEAILLETQRRGLVFAKRICR